MARDRYLVQGGDWGAHVGAWPAANHPRQVAGLHLNGVFVRQAGYGEGSGRVPPDASARERAALAAEVRRFGGPDFAYSQLQVARPLALTYALADSPLGAAAWLADKYHSWSDRRGRASEAVVPRDFLPGEAMTYLRAGTFDTAAWSYAGFAAEPPATLPPGRRVEVPTAVAAFPDPLSVPVPRRVAGRAYNVVQWTASPAGGHFPSAEQPAAFVADVRRFGRRVR